MKRGPKPRPAAERRTLFNVKLTPAERDSFRTAAARHGMNVSTWVRFVCLGAALNDSLKGRTP